VTLRTFLAGRHSAALRQTSVRVPPVGKIEEKAVKTHLLCAIALGLAGAATAASAQDGPTSSEFNINSSVLAFCSSLTAPTGALELGELTDGDGQVVETFANSPTYSVAGYYCNAPATIELSAAPLMQTGDPVIYDEAAFTNRVDYQANLVWGVVTDASDQSAGALDVVEIDTGVANIGELKVSVSGPNTDGNRRPVAGTYEGAVTLTVALN
jgi:hypothetical protein